jgi:hypothetical protein
VVLDPTLLEVVDVSEGLATNGTILLNSAKSPANFRFEKPVKVRTVDAASIAVEHKLGTRTNPIVNTAILGGYAKAVGNISLEPISKAIEENVCVDTENNVKAAKSACIGASAAGARVCTASASQGLALMHEMLFVASGMRLPIVMGIGNRALSAPINIWCDHQDTVSERDAGWLQFYAEKNQEALDLMIIAFKIAEDERVLLPAMVGFDGFVLTHTMDAVDVPD